MKKALCASVAVLLAASALSAVEWGGVITNETMFAGKVDSLKLKQSDSADLWLNVPFNKTNSINLSAEGYYKFVYDDTEIADETFENVLNLSLLEFSLSRMIQGGKVLSVSAGRFSVSDLTGFVFDQAVDGVSVGLSTAAADFSVFAGYTGLLNSKEVTIITPDDTEYEESSGALYTLAPKYLPFGFSAVFPSLFANQNLSFEGWGFVDFNGDSYSRYYASVGLDGFLMSRLFYKIQTVFGTENFESLMNLTLFSLDFNPVNKLGVRLYGVYASGEQGKLSAFSGFSSVTAVSARFEDILYSSLLTGGFVVSNTFGNILFVSAGGSVLFDISDSSAEYFGIQFSADVLWNIFHDVQVGFSASQLICEQSDNSRTALSLKAALAF